MIPANLVCSICRAEVFHDKDTDYLYCACPGRKVALAYYLQGSRPVSWYTRIPMPHPPSPPPFDSSKCLNCKKDLAIVGLNKTYPPKLSVNGDPICPHCGHVQFIKMPDTSGTALKIKEYEGHNGAPWQDMRFQSQEEAEAAYRGFGNFSKGFQISDDYAEDSVVEYVREESRRAAMIVGEHLEWQLFKDAHPNQDRCQFCQFPADDEEDTDDD